MWFTVNLWFCSSRDSVNSNKIPSALPSAEGTSYTIKADILPCQNSLQKPEHSPLSGKGLPTDGCIVTVGLSGSLVVLETTGGNSPLAEMRKTRRMNDAFFSVYAAVKWDQLLKIPSKKKKMASPL